METRTFSRTHSHPSPVEMSASFKSIGTDFVVFLDRDGVINRKLPGGRFVCQWSEFEFLPGAQEAIRTLNQSAIKAILVTNQRGVSLGLYSEVDLQRLHARMTAALNSRGARFDAIYYCPHSKNSCACRKPGTALFEQAFRDFPNAKPLASVVVGDSLSDMKAAQLLGCKKVLVGDGSGTVEQKARQAGIQIQFSSDSLLSAVRQYIIPNFSALTSR